MPAPSLIAKHVVGDSWCSAGPIPGMRRCEDVTPFGGTQERFRGPAGERRVVLRDGSGSRSAAVRRAESRMDSFSPASSAVLLTGRVVSAGVARAGIALSNRVPDVVELMSDRVGRLLETRIRC